mmetsp:Transcript_35586/g.54404  ORF Transcript_35586/g.54404 Transcript_35586/m.54404 type:complete len:83 (+) Transcript_35586:859-1107(+)
MFSFISSYFESRFRHFVDLPVGLNCISGFLSLGEETFRLQRAAQDVQVHIKCLQLRNLLEPAMCGLEQRSMLVVAANLNWIP